MNAETIAKSTASAILLILVAALIACYFSACSSFRAEASVNPITGSARISIQSTK